MRDVFSTSAMSVSLFESVQASSTKNCGLVNIANRWIERIRDLLVTRRSYLDLLRLNTDGSLWVFDIDPLRSLY